MIKYLILFCIFFRSQLVVGLIETGKKQETRPAVRSLSMTAGSHNITGQSGLSAKLSQTAPNAALGWVLLMTICCINSKPVF